MTAESAHLPPLLKQRSFAALWWGQLISILGERLTYLALGGLLLEHTHRGQDPRYATLLAVLGNVMVAPVLLFSPFTGAWVDRWNLRRVLIWSDLLRAVLVFALPHLYRLTGLAAVPMTLVFLLFTCNVFFLPAKSAITPEIVPPRQLLGANSLLAAAGIIATAVGALAGGWVVDHWGWATAMDINAVTYLVSVVSLALIPYRPAAHAGGLPPVTLRGYLGEVGEGWALIRRSPAVALGLVSLGAVWIGGGFLHVAGNQHVQTAASIPGMERIGVLMTAIGLGAGLSTWWVNTRGRHWPRPALLGWSFVLGGIVVVLIGMTTKFAYFSLLGFLAGLFIAPTFTLSETLLQEGTELKQRGRVFSTRDFLMRLAFLLSVTAAASLTHAVGPRVTLWVAGALVALVGFWALSFRRYGERVAAPPH
jgi:MFS family permease